MGTALLYNAYDVVALVGSTALVQVGKADVVAFAAKESADCRGSVFILIGHQVGNHKHDFRAGIGIVEVLQNGHRSLAVIVVQRRGRVVEGGLEGFVGRVAQKVVGIPLRRVFPAHRGKVVAAAEVEQYIGLSEAVVAVPSLKAVHLRGSAWRCGMLGLSGKVAHRGAAPGAENLQSGIIHLVINQAPPPCVLLVEHHVGILAGITRVRVELALGVIVVGEHVAVVGGYGVSDYAHFLCRDPGEIDAGRFRIAEGGVVCPYEGLYGVAFIPGRDSGVQRRGQAALLLGILCSVQDGAAVAAHVAVAKTHRVERMGHIHIAGIAVHFPPRLGGEGAGNRAAGRIDASYDGGCAGEAGVSVGRHAGAAAKDIGVGDRAHAVEDRRCSVGTAQDASYVVNGGGCALAAGEFQREGVAVYDFDGGVLQGPGFSGEIGAIGCRAGDTAHVGHLVLCPEAGRGTFAILIHRFVGAIYHEYVLSVGSGIQASCYAANCLIGGDVGMGGAGVDGTAVDKARDAACHETASGDVRCGIDPAAFDAATANHRRDGGRIIAFGRYGCSTDIQILNRSPEIAE